MFFAYAAVTADETHLFISEKQASDAVKAHLKGVQIHPYGDVISWLEAFAAKEKKSASNGEDSGREKKKGRKVWFSNHASQGLVRVLVRLPFVPLSLWRILISGFCGPRRPKDVRSYPDHAGESSKESGKISRRSSLL